MPKLLSLCILASLLSAVEGSAFAQLLTIPEQLAREGTDLASVSGVPSGPVADVDIVLRETAVVVRGIVGKPVSYLSSDQTRVFSDYPIIKPLVLFDSSVNFSPKPGYPAEIVVTLEGGKITIGGLTFTHVNTALPELELGSECLFLLKRADRKLLVVGNHYGAFQITTGKLLPLTRKSNFAPTYRGELASTGIARLLEHLHSVRK